jgi:hypothetical protein
MLQIVADRKRMADLQRRRNLKKEGRPLARTALGERPVWRARQKKRYFRPTV